jgi:hypothetical protein
MKITLPSVLPIYLSLNLGKKNQTQKQELQELQPLFLFS